MRVCSHPPSVRGSQGVRFYALQNNNLAHNCGSGSTHCESGMHPCSGRLVARQQSVPSPKQRSDGPKHAAAALSAVTCTQGAVR